MLAVLQNSNVDSSGGRAGLLLAHALGEGAHLATAERPDQ
jgi:hypothetical protein